MSSLLLHYFHDPLCGWCYAAAPLVKTAVGERIAFRLHGGGLWDQATTLTADRRHYIRMNDRRIADLTGLPFGEAYLDGLLQDDATVLWSRPTIAAVVTAGRLRAGAELEMLKAIQMAHYMQGRRVVDIGVLADVAGEVGLAIDDFAAALADSGVDEHIADSRRLMEKFGLRGFPSFVLEQDGRWQRIQHELFYGKPEAFVRELRSAAASPQSQVPMVASV